MYVIVDAPDGSSVQGLVIAGTMDGLLYNLDQPFTVETDDGERIRVCSPWACDIEIDA